MDIRVLTPASQEFVGAVTFYESEAPGLGADFIEEVEAAFSNIKDNPNLGPAYEEQTRRLLLERFPYSIIYEVYSDHVLIVAVAHQKRRPGYWKNRT